MLSSLVEENESLREELHSTKFNMSLRENAIEEKFFDNITSLNSKIELLENDNNMLNIKLNEMKHMKLSAELVTLQLEDESKASLEKAESIEKRYGILNKELYSLKSKLADSRALVTDLETKNEDLITQLKTQSKKVTVLQNSLVEKKQKLSSHKSYNVPLTNRNNWLNDSMMECYFDSFREKSIVGKSILFLGPASTQFLKLADGMDVDCTMRQLSFNLHKFVFCCLSDSLIPDKDDSGSHWSLLVVDTINMSLLHFDSIMGMNANSADKFAKNIGYNPDNIIKMPCIQQKNGFQCGLDVLVNARLLLDGYCNGEPYEGLSLEDWYCKSFGSPLQLLPGWTTVEKQSLNKTVKPKNFTNDKLTVVSNRYSVLMDSGEQSNVDGATVALQPPDNHSVSHSKDLNIGTKIKTMINSNIKSLDSHKFAWKNSSLSCTTKKKKSILVLGDSILKHVTVPDAYVGAFRGARANVLCNKILKFTERKVQPTCVFLHIGTNDLHQTRSPEDVMGAVGNVIKAAKYKFPSAQIILNAILPRHDIEYHLINRSNKNLRWLCRELGVVFLDVSRNLSDLHLAKDGIHLNYKGTDHLNRTIHWVASSCKKQISDKNAKAELVNKDLSPSHRTSVMDANMNNIGIQKCDLLPEDFQNKLQDPLPTKQSCSSVVVTGLSAESFHSSLIVMPGEHSYASAVSGVMGEEQSVCGLGSSDGDSVSESQISNVNSQNLCPDEVGRHFLGIK
ncbi:SUMO1 sentrin specific peptidase 8 [Homalodisca vitripennis]|nr:SUMO1 sentrin specific peptidase 8 [Homalodisca vitripennis]